MIVLRKKADNSIWMSWEDSVTVTLNATKVSGTSGGATEESFAFTDADYELVTGVTLPSGYRDGACYSFDGSDWVVVNATLKKYFDDLEDAEKTAQGR
tara:strand:+ start:2601 stop:2894 length:294 start_codon:yes stop_codon:yes gene_type:complete